jgi:hypothetical protein
MALTFKAPVSRIHRSRPENDRKWPATDLRPGIAIGADVTALRLTPVAQPTPAPAPLPVPVDETPYEIVSAAVEVAVESLETLQRSMEETADAFRWSDPREGNRRLAALVTGLRLLTTLADVAAHAAGLDLTALNARNSGPGPLDEMGFALDMLASQQLSEDHLAMADTLRRQLAPAVAGWREVFAEVLVHADNRFRARRVS